MIITRTPLRISLGGGGTDLPGFYREAGPGFLIAAAITKYVFISVHENFDDDILLKYSTHERVLHQGDIEHPIFRECLAATGEWSGIEISSLADIPAGTGLGSSGAFTVGLLHALWRYRHRGIERQQLAAQAVEIELDRLGEPTGKQDQYIAALGGVTGFTFHPDEGVDVEPLPLSPSVRNTLEENLLLFYSGTRRSASEALEQEKKLATDSGVSLTANLSETRRIGYRTRDALVEGDLESFGTLLTEQWMLKYDRQPTALHREIDGLIAKGVDAGAFGGKLVGAGGGGFLLFYAERKALLRSEMARLGLREVTFRFDYEGSVLVGSA